MDLFKNAARIHTAFAVARYLMANADGRQDGAEKAQRHIELCSFYVAATHGAAPEQVIVDYSEAFEAVHEATQELTSYMDEQIGFPLTGRPDYDRLAPLFFDRFHALAMQALRLNMAEQAPVQAGPDWQPIETAPKDGTEILAADSEVEGGFMQVVAYDALYSAPWRTQEDYGYSERAFTHWMPRPQPPKESTAQSVACPTDKEK